MVKYFELNDNKFPMEASTTLMGYMYNTKLDFSSIVYPEQPNKEEAEQRIKIGWLVRFIKDLDIIFHVGNWDHSGDWDPYLQIEKVSGEVIETSSGYFQLEIEGYPDAFNVLREPMEDITLLCFDTKDDDYEDSEFTHKWKFSEIKSITLFEG